MRHADMARIRWRRCGRTTWQSSCGRQNLSRKREESWLPRRKLGSPFAIASRGRVLFRDSGPEIRIKKKEFSHEPLEGVDVLEAWACRQHRADCSLNCYRAGAEYFGPDQAGVVADADDHVDADDAAAGGGGKDCGDASGAAGADAVDDGWCGG